MITQGAMLYSHMIQPVLPCLPVVALDITAVVLLEVHAAIIKLKLESRLRRLRSAARSPRQLKRKKSTG